MLDRITIPVEQELKQVEEVLIREAASGLSIVDPIARYVIGNGGKRIRPALFLLAARVVGATGPMAELAAAMEMLHTASLLHDDVVDDAHVRRGKPSAKAKWGNQVSVLVGDLFLCRASRILVKNGSARLMEAVSEAISKTTEGELLEISHQNDSSVDADLYMRIIGGKTAALFSLSARAAAIITELGGEFEDALLNFGQNVGLAFQLADDALDYVADEERFGKLAGTDLREGKLTYPLIVALGHASPDERALIKNSLISGKGTPEKFKEIAAIIEKHGGIEATWKIAREYAAKAKESLAVFKPSIERDSLTMLADYAVARDE